MPSQLLTRVPALLGVALALAACTAPVGPQNSGIDIPTHWAFLHDSTEGRNLSAPLVGASEDAQIDQQWWQRFNDPTLNAIVAEALARNQTLQIARARVEEAQAQRRLAESSLFPQINGELSAQRGNQGYATQNTVVTVKQADLAASWEIDVFGGNQARTAQAGAILQSAEASRQAVRVGLLAEVARTYFEWRDDERQLAIARENLRTQQRTLELIQVQFKGAFASDFDVQRAAAQVSATEARIPSLEASGDAARNRLNVLMGYPPGTKDQLLETPVEPSAIDPRLVIAAPARVLAERPDVRVAERQLAGSISGARAARAALFPNISLTALYGAQSATPFSSTPWGVGVNLVQPILNFGRTEALIDGADAQQREAFQNYQKVVLEALENMEGALSDYVHESARNSSLAAGVIQNRRAAGLAEEQFKNGYTGLLDVLVVQRDLLDAEAAAATSDARLRSDLVGIYVAAGGGWRE